MTIYAIRTGHTGANGWGIQQNTTHTIGANDVDVIAVIDGDKIGKKERKGGSGLGVKIGGASCIR